MGATRGVERSCANSVDQDRDRTPRKERRETAWFFSQVNYLQHSLLSSQQPRAGVLARITV